MAISNTSKPNLWTAGFLVIFVAGAALFSIATQGEEGKKPKLSILQQLGGYDSPLADKEEQVTVTATITAENGGPSGELKVEAKIAPGWHIYSTTQVPVGALPTKMSLISEPEIERLGEFTPNHKPINKTDPFVKGTLEEHEGTVIWTVPVRVPQEITAENSKVQLKYNGQACKDQCVPINKTIDVQLVGFKRAANEATKEPKVASTTFIGEYRAARSHVTIRGHVEPQVVEPGSKAKLVITAEADPKWHIYEYRSQDPVKVSKPTLIVFTKTAGWKTSTPIASPAAPEESGAGGKLPYHEGTVAWTVDIEVPSDTPAGEYELAGLLGYQSCFAKQCDFPTGAEFGFKLRVGETAQAGQIPLVFSKSNYTVAAKLAGGAEGPMTPETPEKSEPKVEAVAGGIGLGKIEVIDDGASQRSFMSAIFVALLGGFLLNFMPCVLPVIGLKVMSFVQQSGHNWGKALMLNVWYSLGLLFVFMVLATLAVGFNLRWGQQNQYGAFNVTMVAIVFAMGLSFLGVWEIPIPGFIGSSKAAEFAQQEGSIGAFLKGVVTTILAVPCTGPGVATALAWCKGKPGPVVFAVFACMALGMASPYLLIGANPRLAKFIPKPGMWMETFKELMGFVLLATVVFILSYIAWSDVVPTIALLFGIWGACWFIGRVPITVSPAARQRAWAISIFIVALTATLSFTKLRAIMEERFQTAANLAHVKAVAASKPHNQAFSVSKLQELTAAGNTVLVDFTADWCLICKTLEAGVLNTKTIQESLKEHQVVTLVADWTTGDLEITSMLENLGSEGVPVLALFPANNPNKAFVLRGAYTSQQLEEKIRQASASPTPDTKNAIGMTQAKSDVK